MSAALHMLLHKQSQVVHAGLEEEGCQHSAAYLPVAQDAAQLSTRRLRRRGAQHCPTWTSSSFHRKRIIDQATLQNTTSSQVPAESIRVYEAF